MGGATASRCAPGPGPAVTHTDDGVNDSILAQWCHRDRDREGARTDADAALAGVGRVGGDAAGGRHFGGPEHVAEQARWWCRRRAGAAVCSQAPVEFCSGGAKLVHSGRTLLPSAM